MNTNTVPALNAENVNALSDDNLIAWYSKHPNPTVRALVQRIAYMKEQHTGELVSAYQDGFAAAQDHFEKPELGLTPEELRLGAIHSFAE